jgi:subtilisin-like proprotein convertase family protein/uncharacterized protein YvpB
MQSKNVALVTFIGILFLVVYLLAIEKVSAKTPIELVTEATQSFVSEINISFPLVFKPADPTPVPPDPDPKPKTLFCNQPGTNIPDNNQNGISNTIAINDHRFIGDMEIRLNIDHTWVGDLQITLTHAETGHSIRLMDRPGYAGGNDQGCNFDNIRTILDDDISLPVENECSSFPAATAPNAYIQAAIAGIYIPDQLLSFYDTEPISGNWTLTISDLAPHDTGKLNEWCIAVELIDTPVLQPEPPPPSGMPNSALITGVHGQPQSLPLDCESRSAVDWANYFGVGIGELKFFNGLPSSDNPDLGFVGNVFGTWGQIPPNAYGVHAIPIANRLKEFGLPAIVHQPLSWPELKAEIAAGRPVIVWILGSRYSGYDYVVNGIPEYYRPSEGNISIVARYEHTVVVTGYSQDSVSYLNGGTIYQKDQKQFLESWSALGNMAITMKP